MALTKNINSMVNLMKLISLYSIAEQLQICKFFFPKYLFPARRQRSKKKMLNFHKA